MLIDAHTHIDHYDEHDLRRAIDEINKNKILSLSNSMNIDSYIKNKEIAKLSPYIIPTFGIHPWKAKGYKKRLDELIPYIEDTPIIGEIGLDFFWVEDKSTFPEQIQVFEFFLKYAKNLNKIVNVHTKGAEDTILDLLNKYSIDRAIIHWYSGPLDILKKMIERGYYFTVSTELNYSPIIKEIASIIPKEKILVETDGPGAEQWLSGSIGMPILIKDVLKTLSNTKKIPFNHIENLIESNFKTLIESDLVLNNYDIT